MVTLADINNKVDAITTPFQIQHTSIKQPYEILTHATKVRRTQESAKRDCATVGTHTYVHT